jgi:hypothetical protein
MRMLAYESREYRVSIFNQFLQFIDDAYAPIEIFCGIPCGGDLFYGGRRVLPMQGSSKHYQMPGSGHGAALQRRHQHHTPPGCDNVSIRPTRRVRGLQQTRGRSAQSTCVYMEPSKQNSVMLEEKQRKQ